MYLGLPERKAYLDAIRPADDGDFGPIVAMLFSTYLDQHRDISDKVKTSVEEIRTIPGIDALSKEFARLKKNTIRQEINKKKWEGGDSQPGTPFSSPTLPFYKMLINHGVLFTKSSRSAPQWGQVHSPDKVSNEMPGEIPPSSSPRAGSYV